jgi:hypothetical protein
MNEQSFVTWLLGFSMGVMLVLGADRIFSEPVALPDMEMVRAEQLMEMYQRGKAEALHVSGSKPNFELEQSCLSLWATKQAKQ